MGNLDETESAYRDEPSYTAWALHHVTVCSTVHVT